jgi:hypothetical protein
MEHARALNPWRGGLAARVTSVSGRILGFSLLWRVKRRVLVAK